VPINFPNFTDLQSLAGVLFGEHTGRRDRAAKARIVHSGCIGQLSDCS
jgi:hypothetical protein